MGYFFEVYLQCGETLYYFRAANIEFLELNTLQLFKQFENPENTSRFSLGICPEHPKYTPATAPLVYWRSLQGYHLCINKHYTDAQNDIYPSWVKVYEVSDGRCAALLSLMRQHKDKMYPVKDTDGKAYPPLVSMGKYGISVNRYGYKKP